MICAELRNGILETLDTCTDDSLVVFDYVDFDYMVDSIVDGALNFGFLFIVNFMFCIYLWKIK